MRKKVGIIKRVLCLSLIFLISINSFAAVVSDNDGSAFITKAEFDSLKNSFQSQIDGYNTSIDSKIDGAIAAYLAGIKFGTHEDCELITDKIKDLYWVDDIGMKYTKYPNTTAVGSITTYDGAIAYGFGSGDPVEPMNTFGSWTYYMRPLDKLRYSDVPKVYIKHYFQRDKACIMLTSQFHLTESVDTWPVSQATWMPLLALETEVGAINRVISNYGIKQATFACKSAYGSANLPGAQTNDIPSHKTYGKTWDYYVLAGDATYCIRPAVYNTDSTAVWKYTEFYDDMLLHDYWGLENMAGILNNSTGADYPRDQSFATLFDGSKLVFGKKIDGWVGTVKNKNNKFETTYGTNTWGTGYSRLVPVTYDSQYSFMQGASYAPTWTDKCSTKTVSYSVPNYYSKGKLESYHSAVLAQSGLEVGLCDGAPLFKPSTTGLAHCRLTVTTNNLTAAPISNVQINIKEDKFSNSITGNGNTLKYTDSHGAEIDYLQNLTSTSGNFDLYFNVIKGKTYYIKITPQDPTGQYYAQITDAVISVDGE